MPVTRARRAAHRVGAVWLACATVACADGIRLQQPAPPDPVITESAVLAQMEFLASDALGGRRGGTADELVAATFIASNLRRLGVRPVATETGYVQRIARERLEWTSPPTLAAGGRQWQHGREIVVESMPPTRLSAPLQKLVPGARVRPGAMVLVPPDAPEMRRAQNGDEWGPEPPVAILRQASRHERAQWHELSATLPPLPSRFVGTPAPIPPHPAIVLMESDAFAAVWSLPDATELTLAGDIRALPDAQTWNVVGELPGTDRDAGTILLSAHLDHLGRGPEGIFNGADDDASGCVAVLQLAEVIARRERPRRTVAFAWFGSEEGGGLGAQYFVERSTIALDTIVANLQFEMLGRPDPQIPPQTLWMTGFSHSNLGPELAKHGFRIVADPRPEQKFFIRSDNIHLAIRGVAAHALSTFGLHADYHTTRDSLERIEIPHLTAAIATAAPLVLWLANSPFRPQVRPMPTEAHQP